LYLIDTDVISEVSKGARANPGVRAFLLEAARAGTALYLSAVTVGELRQGVEAIRHRGDRPQALRLERWLERMARDFADAILAVDAEAAQVWGRLRVPHAENPLDKQIAATALLHDLTVVTRNVAHYQPTGVRVLNPFV
jgi:predicted nucleic acid-binding protein